MPDITREQALQNAIFACDRSEAIHSQVAAAWAADTPLTPQQEAEVIEASELWAIRAQAWATIAASL